MADLREYFRRNLEEKIITTVMLKKDVSGYAEASEIIRKALDDLEATVSKKPVINLNQSE